MATAKLTTTQIEMALREFPSWKLNTSGQIEKVFEFSGFPQSLLFVNATGLIAEKQNHHPDILVQWNKVKLSVNTHDAGGITQKDFDLAKAVDQLPLI